MVAHAKFMCRCFGTRILPAPVNADAAAGCGNSQYNKLNKPGCEDPAKKDLEAVCGKLPFLLFQFLF